MGQKGIILNTREEGYIDSKDFASFLSAMNGNSGVLNYKEALKITRLNDNKVRIASGIYCLDGRMIIVDNYIDLVVENGTLGMNRIDLVVAEFLQDGKEEGTDILHLRVLKGTPSSTLPTEPKLINDGTIVQEKLYSLKITNTSLSLENKYFSLIHGNADFYVKSEIDNKIEDSYSYQEQKTNRKWIDGKDIYKKSINMGVLVEKGSKYIDHNISTIDTLVEANMTAYSTIGETYRRTIPNTDSDILINPPHQVRFLTNGDYRNYSGIVTLWYTKK